MVGVTISTGFSWDLFTGECRQKMIRFKIFWLIFYIHWRSNAGILLEVSLIILGEFDHTSKWDTGAKLPVLGSLLMLNVANSVFDKSHQVKVEVNESVPK